MNKRCQGGESRRIAIKIMACVQMITLGGYLRTSTFAWMVNVWYVNDRAYLQRAPKVTHLFVAVELLLFSMSNFKMRNLKKTHI